MAALRLRLALALFALCAVALAGCSGKSGDGSSSTPTTTGAGMSASVGMSASGSMSQAPTSSSSSSSNGPAPLSGNVARDITDNAFPDGTFTLKLGSTVTWTDKGNNPHSVTSDGNFDSSPNCPPACLTSVPGANTFSHKFDAAGAFNYHCKIHASMTGTITVVA